MAALNPFHLAIPVLDLDQTPAFYEVVLGCSRGRASDAWIDLSLFGHQLVLHQACREDPQEQEPQTNPVDGENIPVPHFGVVLDWAAFDALVERIEHAGADFLIAPTTRFDGRAGEHRTCFLSDPSGNYLEFKTFKNLDSLFAQDLEKYN